MASISQRLSRHSAAQRAGAALLCLALAHPVHAARPMVTDDARTTESRACQLETWVRNNRDSTEYWALPACNFTGNLEVTFGGALGENARGTETTDIVLQGKTLLRPLTTNGWGLGLAFGNVRHPAINPRSNLIGDLYGYIPLSVSFLDDRFVLHTNLGWLHEKHGSADRLTAGIGSETRLAQRTWLIAEGFGQSDGPIHYQLGLRHWLIANRLQIDTTYGNRFGNGGADDSWISIGLRITPAPFMPW